MADRMRSARTLAVAGLAALIAVVSGCDSIDPTEQSFGITFRNDTRHDVHLKLCADDACRHFYYSYGRKAGASGQENISDRAFLTRWLVQDEATGRTLGCLPLKFDQKYDDVLVRVSQMVPCPGSRPLTVQKGKPLGRS